MTDKKPTPAPEPTYESAPLDAVSPDELMSDFRGHSLIKIVIFTVIVHVFILAIFSPGYIKAQVFGESEAADEEVAELSDEEKLAEAQKDGKAALREVADKYGLTIKELREQLDAEQPDTPAAADPADATATTEEPDEPASAIEKELDVEAEGPKLPDLSIEEEEDIFAPESP